MPESNATTLDASFAGEPERSPSSEIASQRLRYFGDYELQREIARGGMGIVCKARQVSLNRVVAVKMILAGNLATEAEIKRFRTEAEAAANLKHPNIVAIHEVGEHEGQHYFSMDYVEGKNLSEITNGEPLHPTTAGKYVQTLADAVHFAHQRGTLHRDLKPQNVLIDSSGQPHITDFGLAKLMNEDASRTRSGAIMGSPSYMPPEQAAGRQDQVGPHSDTYSLGAILYELLTGRPPFRAETMTATLAKVLDELPVPPRKLNPQIPAELETICLKCLEKEPSRRYASARELSEDLGRLLRQEPIRARPASTTRKVALWFKRNPWLLTGVISAIAVGLVWLAYALWAENRDLVWEKTHPGVVYSADWLTQNFAEFSYLILPLIAVLPWGKLFERKRRERIMTGKRIAGGVLLAHGLLAVIGVALALYLGIKTIDFYRWDNQPGMQFQRTAEFEKWQKLTSRYPHLPGNKPRLKGVPTPALVLWLGLAFIGVSSAASLLRKVGQEYLFIMFPSAEEEEIERYCAMQAKLRDDKSFGIYRARPRKALRLTAISSVVAFGVVATFAVMIVRESEMVSYLVIPAATVAGWAFSLALVMVRQGCHRRWVMVRIVCILASVVAICYLFDHHESELIWFGLVFGCVAGLAHGLALRVTLSRCHRWGRKSPARFMQ